MIKLGLLGANISHSRSQEMYESILKQKIDYRLIDIQVNEEVPALDSFFLGQDLKGLSITYPYKKHFLKEVTIEDELIKSLNAINCIEHRNGKYYATNTDFLAAVYLLTEKYFKSYSNFIVLGSGNMAKVFEVAFRKLGKDINVLSRKKNGDLNQFDYKTLDINERTLIINTCSREYRFNPTVSFKCGFWDMNYSFEPHADLEKKGMVYHEGLDLLLEQARFALKFWKMGHLIKNL